MVAAINYNKAQVWYNLVCICVDQKLIEEIVLIYFEKFLKIKVF